MKNAVIILIFLFISIVSVFKTGLSEFIALSVIQFVTMGLFHLLILKFVKIKYHLFLSLFMAILIAVIAHFSIKFLGITFPVARFPRYRINRITQQCDKVEDYINGRKYWYEDLVYGQSCGASKFY